MWNVDILGKRGRHANSNGILELGRLIVRHFFWKGPWIVSTISGQNFAFFAPVEYSTGLEMAKTHKWKIQKIDFFKIV